MLKIQKTTASPAETVAFAEQVGKRLHAGDVIAYFGGLGVGKTTFTRGLAKGMGLPDVVSSPTFAIVQEYHGSGLSLYHFDMYRIEGQWIWNPRASTTIHWTRACLPLSGRRTSCRNCRQAVCGSPLNGFLMRHGRSQ